MPQYEISVPGSGSYRIDSPSDLTDEQVWQAVQGQISAAPPAPSKERTFGEATKDIGAGLVSGVGSLTQLPGQLYGLATGNMEDTGVLGAGKAISKYGEEMKSEGLKAREAERAQKIAESAKEGQIPAFKTALAETIKDPGLLLNFIAEQVPQLAVPFGVGRIGAGIARAGGAGAEAAGLAGAGAAAGAGVVQQGADVGAGAYDDIYKELKKQGISDKDAAEGTLNLARAAGASGALISYLTNKLPGAQKLEKIMAGLPAAGSRLGTAAKTVAGEVASEVPEEVGGKISQNLAMKEVKPDQAIMEGTGETAAMAALGAGALGGATGLASRQPAQEKPAEPAAPAAVAPIAPMPPMPEAPQMKAPEELPKLPELGAPIQRPQLGKPAEPEAPVPETPAPDMGIPITPPAPPPPPTQFTPEEMAALSDYTSGLPSDAAKVFEGLQNRDRATPASIQQMKGISSKPDYDRLKVSPDFAQGAPVVMSDIRLPEGKVKNDIVTAADGRKIPVSYRVVSANDILTSHDSNGQRNPDYVDVNKQGIRAVAGNGRIAGLQAAYQNGTANDYLKRLSEDTSHGISAEDIAKIKNPILVRVMPKSYVSKDIGDVSNISAGLGFNPVEKAKNDAGRFDLGGLQFKENKDGSLDINEATAMQFVLAMPKTEQAEMLDGKGRPNTMAIARLNNAIFHKAYNSDTLIDLFAQATDPEARLILRALQKAAPKAFQLEGAGEYDIRKNIIDAAELAVNAKRDGVKLKDYVKQGMIGIDPNTLAVLEMFADHSRSGVRMGDILTDLADNAYKQSQAGDDMFGAVPKVPVNDLFKFPKNEKPEEPAVPPAPPPKPPVAPPKPPAAPPAKPAVPKKPAAQERKEFVIDKPLEQIAEEITGMTIPQLAQWTVDNAPNSAAKEIATKVLARLKELNTKGLFPSKILILNDGRRNTKGVRGRVTSSHIANKGAKVTLTLNGLVNGKADQRTGTNYITILHELTHAATSLQISYSPNSKAANDLKVLHRKVVAQIKSDTAKGVKHPILDRINRGANTVAVADELLTWGFTDNDFQDYLSTIKIGETNAMGRLVTIVRNLLGLSEKHETALEGVMRIGEDLLNTSILDLELGLNPSVKLRPMKEKFENREDQVTEQILESKMGDMAEKAVGAADASQENFFSLESTSPYLDLLKRNQSFKRKIDKLNKDLDSGKIELGGFANSVKWAADEADRTREAAEPKPRERGADYIRQRLLEAKRRGDLSEEAVDFAEWFIQRNPQLLDDLGISIVKGSDEGVSGQYIAMSRIMKLIKESGNDTTIVHEILHHMERMMPADVQRAIRLAWLDTTSKLANQAIENKKDDPKLAEYFEKLILGSGAIDNRSSSAILKQAVNMIQNGDVDYKYYQYLNPSEFWAINGTRIMQGRFDAVRGGTLQKLKNWLKELGQKIKSIFGLDSDAPIIKAIDSLSKADGKFVSEKMLGDVADYFSITEKVVGAASQAMQKRAPINKEALKGVNPAYAEALGKVFNPQSETFVDKVAGMKDGFWRRAAQGIADQYRTIKDYSEEAYMLARMSKTIDGALEGLLFHGHVIDEGGALNIDTSKNGLLDVLKPVGQETDRYMMWIALNREARLPLDKRSPNMADLLADRNTLAEGQLDGKSRLEIYRKVQKDMNSINKSVLDIALKKGLINSSVQDIAALRERTDLSPKEISDQIAELERNPGAYERFSKDIFYIPFYKQMESGDLQGASTASGLTSQEFSKSLEGKTDKPFGDLMENTLRNWSHILSASMKNAASNSTLDAAMNVAAAIPNLKPQYAWEDGRVVSAKTGEIVGDGSLQFGQTKSGKGMVKTMVNGSPMYFEVLDPMLLDSISAIGYTGPKSKFLDVSRDFKNMLQYGVTLAPGFKVRNLIRDSVSAMAVSGLSKNPIANVIEGLSISDPSSPMYISALAGGGIFNFGSTYEGDQAKLVKRLLEKGVKSSAILDTPGKIKNALRAAHDAYQELGNKSEAANRMALYKQMRDKGMSHLEASYHARDLLDFSMQGSWPAFRLLTQVVPFMNARIQGLYKLGRDGVLPTARVIYNTATGKPIEGSDRMKAQAFSIVSTAVALASLALYFAFKDDEDFMARDEWDRDNFWWFKLPGMDYAFRIPKPFEIGALGTIAERVAEQIFDEGAEGKQIEDSMKRMIGDTFSLNPMPQIFKPMVDLYANKDSFSGAPIESSGMERLSKQERITDNTSPLAILLGGIANVALPKKTEMSPVQVDYAIKAYFGWLGASASWMSHYATMPFTEGTRPDNKWTDTMSMGFIKDLPSNQSKYVTSFYEHSIEINQAYADMRHFAEIGDAAKVEEIIREKGDLIAMEKFYDKTSKDMAKIRVAIRIITTDKDMPGDQKREEIDRLKILLGLIAEQAEGVRKEVKRQ